MVGWWFPGLWCVGVSRVCAVSCSLVCSVRSLGGAVCSFLPGVLASRCPGAVGALVRPLAVGVRRRGAVFLALRCRRVRPLLGSPLALCLSGLCRSLYGWVLVCVGARGGVAGCALVVAVVLPPALAAAPGGVVALAGSRSLPPGGAGLVAGVARSLVSAGAVLVVGCAAGADAVVLAAVPPGSVRVFAAFGPGGAGDAGSASAVPVVSRFAAAGGSVVWWAGGGATRPLRARLTARTAAVVSAASVGRVVFLGSPVSRGSLLAAGFAAARGLPVVAFPLGFPPAQLPLLGPGVWRPAGGTGLWASASVWAPLEKQISLF